MSREFNVVIERDEEEYLVASVPSLPGCHIQARSLEELMQRVQEAIALCLEAESEKRGAPAHPWRRFAGMFKDDPDFQDVVEIMAENRRKMDQDPTIP